jgi:hypothetical protein
MRGLEGVRRSWIHRALAILGDRRATVSPLLALMLVPLIGAIGLAGEASGWFLIQRAAQNTADAAVMAAASNGCSSAATCATGTYIDEAKSVAARYGFTNGSDNVTVTATNAAACPAGGANCYQVTVTKLVSISLMSVVGYTGNAKDSSGANAVTIKAFATASAPVPAADCILTKNSFQTNGAPKFNAGGCYLYSDGATTCNGSSLTDLGFTTGFAEGTDKNGKCGAVAVTQNAVDPFASTLANNPISGCTNVGVAGGTYSAPTTLNLSGTCLKVTGNLALSGATTVTTSGTSGSIIEIVGGNLILNGNTLTAAFGQGLTIVFTGASGGTPGFITGNAGTLDFGAPTTGAWSGVALYQDPLMTGDSNPTYSGSSPTFKISGMIYAPNASMNFSGAINHETNGYACIAFIVNNLLINGNGSIFSNPTSQCYQFTGLQGLTSSPNTIAVRQALVQ